MDELSIDSATNQKVHVSDKFAKNSTDCGQEDTTRVQFRIDWRQLTYYQKPTSRLAKFFGAKPIKSNVEGIDGNDLTESKRILNSLDGCFKSGELSAILGPSGAGKSTFLSTLFGAKQEGAYGQTKVTWFKDGQPLAVKRRSIKIAFLPQHDHLLHHLTVYESLLFASKIKNATRPITGKNFHHQNVKRVAKMLKLSDCLDTRCGKLSGGQYKRVSIGQELLSEPDVIILDEPTSGLDAMTCLSTVQTLKSIVVKHPMSIILTIHQPDIDVFNLFDHVYVIAQGGLAIYEGRPQNIALTLAEVGLKIPSASYNPARFIVENAFIAENADILSETRCTSDLGGSVRDQGEESDANDNDDEKDADDIDDLEKQGQNYIKRSVLSLTEAISGKEMASGRRDKKPLLNIGIRTLDGKLITSEQLSKNNDKIQQIEKWNLLKRLNQIQKAKYQNPLDSSYGDSCGGEFRSEATSPQSLDSKEGKTVAPSSAKSDYSSLGWSDHRAKAHECADEPTNRGGNVSQKPVKAVSLAHLASEPSSVKKFSGGNSLQFIGGNSSSDHESIMSEEVDDFVVNFDDLDMDPNEEATCGWPNKPVRMKRQFDKRLSAKHNCSKQKDNPIWYHAFLLTHRTWLSIVRDPIFFGIQACMHVLIPILLGAIFGSVQEEGCPRIGNFDLVDFAYSDSENMIQSTVSSIRQSIGNIGIVFFEMFVLSFSINCITALIFPLDMYVLLKEYRNGWYSMRSYFFGRTLADLPIPILLHSLGMTILYFLTGQPHSLWRYSAIIVLVILASLVAQSVGLTIGALLMKSSQSAVLAAAGIVAPFFALSGFIVRIHTLPLVAQMAAKLSYLYHLLNGFIILRYGFGRCPCKEEDFEENSAHQIPKNLHTLASVWIGTYSNEYADSPIMSANNSSRTNIDPNIDVVNKMLKTFKMANSYGHQIASCEDVLPYAMLDFNVRDQDIYGCFLAIFLMLIVSRFITFTAIYYKIRSFA